MNSTNKFQFKTIDVEKDQIRFTDPGTFDHPLATRKELIAAWNKEWRLREAELEEYYNETYNTRDELVQTPDTDS